MNPFPPFAAASPSVPPPARTRRGGFGDTPWAVALIAVLACAVFVAGVLYLRARTPAVRGWAAVRRFDYSSLVNAGGALCDPARIPAGLTLGRAGFDGQFFYQLSLDPFSARRTQHGITLDAPAYRQERILYPLIVWSLSLGRAQAVPVVMLLVNLLALGVVAWVAGAVAQSVGRHALMGLMVPLAPGFLFTLRSDTCELVDMAFLMASLWSLRRRRPVAAAVLLALSCLTRETSLLVAAAALLAWAWERRQGIRAGLLRWYVPALPFASVLAWQLILKSRWGILPSRQGGNNIGRPFQAFLHLLYSLRTPLSSVQVVWALECLYILGLCAAVLLALRGSAAALHEKIAWALYALLAFSLTQVVWTQDGDFLRTTAGVFVLGGLVLTGAKLPALRHVSWAGSVLLWLLVVWRIVW